MLVMYALILIINMFYVFKSPESHRSCRLVLIYLYCLIVCSVVICALSMVTLFVFHLRHYFLAFLEEIKIDIMSRVCSGFEYVITLFLYDY